MNQSLKKVADVLGQGRHTIGAIVLWTLEAVHIPRAVLRARFEELGLGAAVPEDPSPEACMRRAAGEGMKGQVKVNDRDSKDLPRVLVRECARDEERVTYAIVEERRVRGQKRLDYQQLCRIAVNRTTGKLELEDPDNAVAKKISEAYQRFVETADAQDVSHCLTTALTGTQTQPLLQGLSLRERHGGVYFVHAKHLPTLRLLAQWVEEQTDSTFNVLTMAADAENLEQAARMAKSAFTAKFRELMEELEQWRSESGEDANTRSAKVRLSRFARLRDQAELYKDLLGDMAAELSTHVEVVRRQLVTEFDLDDTEHAA